MAKTSYSVDSQLKSKLDNVSAVFINRPSRRGARGQECESTEPGRHWSKVPVGRP